jgi:hypothetical protein
MVLIGKVSASLASLPAKISAAENIEVLKTYQLEFLKPLELGRNTLSILLNFNGHRLGTSIVAYAQNTAPSLCCQEVK